MIKEIIKFPIILLCVICFLRTASADEPIAWEECIRQAKFQHPDLVSAKEKVNQAVAAKEITRSAVLPQLTGSVSESTSNGTGVSASGSSGQGVTSLQSGSGAGARGASTTYSYGGQIQQLLFDGFKTSYSLSSNERSIVASR